MCAARNIPLVVREKLVKELDYVGVMVGSLKMEEPISNNKIKRQVTEIVLTPNRSKYMFEERHCPTKDVLRRRGLIPGSS